MTLYVSKCPPLADTCAVAVVLKYSQHSQWLSLAD